MDEENWIAIGTGEATETKRQPEKNAPHRPEKSGKQRKGPAWTGEGDSSVERGQRAGPPSQEGGSQWPHKG